jgi:nucleolar protein 4
LNLKTMVTEGPITEIFVRNLSYETTKDDLVAAFQEFGPVKRTVVVEQNHVSRGFGFVRFAFEDDMKKALQAMQGHTLHGRRMKLEQSTSTAASAKLKQTDPAVSVASGVIDSTGADANVDTDLLRFERKVSATGRKKARSPSKAEMDGDSNKDDDAKDNKANLSLTPSANRSRKVFIGGIPLGFNKKSLKMWLSKTVRNEKIENIIRIKPASEAEGQGKVEKENRKEEGRYEYGHEDNHSRDLPNETEKEFLSLVMPEGNSFMVTLTSRKEATKLVERLTNTNAATILPADTLEEQEKKQNTRGKLALRLEADITIARLRKRKCRVILRNLSFQATSDNVATRLSKFGPLVEVTLPMVEMGTENEEDGRPPDGSPQAVAKRRRAKRAAQEGGRLRPRGYAFATFLCEKDATAAVTAATNANNPLKICNRAVAVDFCESKDRYLREDEDEGDGAGASESRDQAQMDVNVEKIENGMEDSSNISSDSDSDSDSDSSDSEGEKEVVVDDENDENDVVVDDENDEENKDEYEAPETETSEVPDDVGEGCTVFLRDLAFDATVHDIRSALMQHGNIRRCFLVRDKTTGDSRGTAFVKFATKRAAQNCVAVARGLEGADALDSAPELERVIAPGQGKIMVLGRAVRADMAVDRAQAAELTEDGEKRRALQDRRNLYLMEEGLKVEGYAKHLLNASDADKRRKTIADKKKKLANTLYFVSPTRISIRNLNKSMKEGDLKGHCLAALKKALNRDLVTAADMDRQLVAQGKSARERTKTATDIPPIQSGTIKSIRMMMDMQRLRNGLPQSRGYAFVEFAHHAHALAVVRQLSNAEEYQHLAIGGGRGPGPRPGKVIVNHRKTPGITKEMLEAGEALVHTSAVDQGNGEKSDNSSELEGSAPARLIVDFCVEDVQKVQLLKAREERLTKSRKDKGIELKFDKKNKKTEKRKRKRDENEGSGDEDVDTHVEVDMGSLDGSDDGNQDSDSDPDPDPKEVKQRTKALKRKLVDTKRKEKELKRQKRALDAKVGAKMKKSDRGWRGNSNSKLDSKSKSQSPSQGRVKSKAKKQKFTC